MELTDRTKYILKEWIEPIVTAIILALILRAFIIQAYKIPTGSMEPTLHGDPKHGDKIMVFKPIYWFREPKRGEIIVFKYPIEPKKNFIKRFIAGENEEVQIKNGNIFINNEIIEDPEIFKQLYYYSQGDYGQEDVPLTVPEDSYYVLGDNSASSKDSRVWGFVPKKNLVGKAILIWWPPSRIGLIK